MNYKILLLYKCDFEIIYTQYNNHKKNYLYNLTNY